MSTKILAASLIAAAALILGACNPTNVGIGPRVVISGRSTPARTTVETCIIGGNVVVTDYGTAAEDGLLSYCLPTTKVAVATPVLHPGRRP